MAEETVVELLVPENTEFDVKVNDDGAGYSSDTGNGDKTLRRTSSIGSDSNLNSSRRNLNSPKITQKPIPNYLRASTGTCHDFCKYGRRRALEEEKAKWPFRKVKKPLPNKLDSAQISVSVENKERLVKHKSSLETNGRSPNSKPFVINSRSPDRKLSLNEKSNLATSRTEKVKVVKQKSSFDTNNRGSPAHSSFIKPPLLPDRKLSLDSKTKLPTLKVENIKVVKQKSSMDTNNRLPDSKSSFINPHAPDRKCFPDRRTSFPLSKVEKSKGVRQNSSENTNKHSLDQKLSTESKSCLPKIRTSLDANTRRPKLDGTSGDKSLPTENTVSSDHSECLPSKTDVPKKKVVTVGKMSKTEEGKYSSSIKVKPAKVNASSSVSSDATHAKTEVNRGLKSARKINTIASGKKGFALSASTYSPRVSLSKSTAVKVKKSISPLNDLNKIQRAETKMTEVEEVPEKTLLVIKTETENNAVELKSEAISNDNNVAPLVPSTPSRALSSNDDNSSYLSREQDDRETEHCASDTDGCSPDNKETLEICEKQSVEENTNKFVKRNKANASEVKYRSPVKLKFRSGRVVDLHTDNTTTPRRLKFRNARILSADQVEGDLSHEQDDQETEHSASDTDGCSPDEKETLEIREKQPVGENKNKFVKRSNAIASEVKYRSPVKLKFRSGKVVDLHTDTTTTAPRRIRFRKARILSADQIKGEFNRRTFKKTGSDNVANNGNSSLKVSLKHQDVSLKHQFIQGKKGERGLFNNVIEETASKLVGTRKSKVLALVGAFETVISLQESKPSAHAAS